MTGRLGKTALITGASSGLGAEFANQLAAKGYDLILVARRKDRLEQVADLVSSTFQVDASAFAADLSLTPDILKICKVAEECSNLELLVNDAGFSNMGRFWKIDMEQELAMLQVHMTAPTLLCRSSIPGMLARNRGFIINVASIAGLIPIRNTMYDSTKSFLITFSTTLANELRDSNIRVQALCPGYLHSEFHDTPQLARFDRSRIPGVLWQTPQFVVSESLNSLQHGDGVFIPGKLYRLVGAIGTSSLTKGIFTSLVRWIMRKRKI